jgi:hypothetical protein
VTIKNDIKVVPGANAGAVGSNAKDNDAVVAKAASTKLVSQIIKAKCMDELSEIKTSVNKCICIFAQKAILEGNFSEKKFLRSSSGIHNQILALEKTLTNAIRQKKSVASDPVVEKRDK